MLDEALAHHQAALQANPRHPDYRQFYRNHLAVLTQNCAGERDQAAALQVAGQLRDLGWDPAADAYTAACGLAQCVAIVENDDQAGKEQRRQQAQFYADQAMTMLRHAVAKGYKDAVHMKKDTDLDPLRKRDDFQKLLRSWRESDCEKMPWRPSCIIQEPSIYGDALRSTVEVVMEENCVSCEKLRPGLASDTPPSYSTEIRARSSAPPASLFSRIRTRRALSGASSAPP